MTDKNKDINAPLLGLTKTEEVSSKTNPSKNRISRPLLSSSRIEEVSSK